MTQRGYGRGCGIRNCSGLVSTSGRLRLEVARTHALRLRTPPRRAAPGRIAAAPSAVAAPPAVLWAASRLDALLRCTGHLLRSAASPLKASEPRRAPPLH